jgi:putative ABC transport system ATP-binding protein
MASNSSTLIATRQQTVARALHATKVYGSGDTAVRALDDVTVEIAGRRFTAVMGPSGSGKSTLMHCMAGLDDLTSGQVFLGDVELGPLPDKQLTLLRREKVGFVFQSFNLLPTLNALENITLPLTLAGRKPDREWVDAVIDTVGLGDRLAHRPSELSGGQQQRIAIARALLTDPALILADEPTGNLDSHSSLEILAILQRLNDEGRTIVMVTHERDVSEHARRVVRMRDGLVVEDHVILERRTAEDALATAVGAGDD